jgi:hypothetical protein
MDYSYATRLAIEMIQADTQRNKLFDKMDRMFHVDWTLPEGIKGLKWVRTVKNSDPSDSVKTAIQIFSGLDPRVKIVPLADDEDNKAKAAEWERYAATWLKEASLRRRTSLIRDILRSAILYDMVAANVTYLPWQEKIAKQPGDEKRWKNARDEYGDWMVNIRHPKDIHVNYSDVVPEEVLYVSKWRIQNILDFYGKAAKEIKKWVNDENPANLYDYLYIYEYTSIDRKIVWAGADPNCGGDTYHIINEDNALPFLPWACRVGGTTLETDSQYQVDPLLASVYRSGDWETVNIAQSLLASDMIARAAAPRHLFTGPGGEVVEFDYGTPGGRVNAPAGVIYAPIPVEPVDQNLPTVVSMLTQAIAKSTLPSIMTQGDIPSNIQYATMNMAIQSGVAKIRPYRDLSEQVTADICKLFFKWIKHNGDSVFMNGMSKADYGKQYILVPAELPERMFLTVELAPDVPTDRQQRITAAATARRELGYSQESALEEIGVTDPKREMDQSYREKTKEAIFQNEMSLMQQKDQMALQLQNQQAQMQMQQEAQAQQMQAQMNQQANNQGLEQPINGGQQNNPSGGGLPPAMADPTQTREMQTGMTQGGQSVGY